MKKKKLKKYDGGGELLGQLAPQLLNLALPGLGTALSPIVGGVINQASQKRNELQMLTDHYNSVKTSTNPYGYMKDGGQLQGSYSLPEFQGASHNQGGIQTNSEGVPSTNPVAEVEDGETKYTIGGKTFIFSKSLTV